MSEDSTAEMSELDEEIGRDVNDDVASEQYNVYIHLLLSYIAPSLFCLISVVGVIGNSFVIYVIASSSHMRSSATNILLLNLAVADLYFLTVCAPFMAYKYATVSWNFGDLACKLVGFSTYTSSYVTVYTLVAISALRYFTSSFVTSVSLKADRTTTQNDTQTARDQNFQNVVPELLMPFGLEQSF